MVRRRSTSLPAGYPARDAASYRAFREALAGSGCTLCPLSAGRTRIVVDRGNPQARILAVGEAPGAEEDRTGQAFVGRAGKLLDALLLDAGLDPARDLLIANVVKCRPPGNRPPRPEEARKCLPFLRRQLELVRPGIVVLLGATAVRHLLPLTPRRGHSRSTGRFFRSPEFPGTDLMILFHPAYILRNPRKRPEMVRHLSAVRERLAEMVRAGIPLN